MRGIAWTEEEDNILRELYPTTVIPELSRILGRTPDAIGARVYILKIKKDPEWKRARCLRTAFKKGHIPPVKGKTWDECYSKEQQEKMRAHCFKKGQRPHNKAPLGHERRAYGGHWLVKVAEPNVYRRKHRVLWEQHYGPIPKGVLISFKDGNKDNVTIENLFAETVAEKFSRCGNIHNVYPPEIAKLVILKGALKRQINRTEKKNGNKRSNRTTGKDEG